MVQTIDTLDHQFIATVPNEALDPPQFGRLKETVKDVLKWNLEDYFNRQKVLGNWRLEVPTLEKYSSVGTGLDPYESALRVVRKFPDILEKLPHVCVLATSIAENPLSIGSPILSAVQFPPQVTATLPEPYDVNDGDQFVIVTYPPSQNRKAQTSTLVLDLTYLPLTSTPGHVLASDLATLINKEALFTHASVTQINGLNYLTLATGGVLGQGTPNSIQIDQASTASLLAATGLGRTGTTATSITGTRPTLTLNAPVGTWTRDDIGQNQVVTLTGTTTATFNDGTFPITAVSLDGSQLAYTNKYGISEALPGSASWYIGKHDDAFNVLRPPSNRYGYMFDVGIQIQVLTDDDQTRDQVSDLVSSFFAFFLEHQFHTFLGRSILDPSIVGENYQIIFKSDLNSSSESELPVGQSGTDKINVEVFGLTAHVVQTLDRTVVVPYGPRVGQGWMSQPGDVNADPSLPLPG